MNLIDSLSNEFQQLLSDQKKNQVLKPLIQGIIDDIKKHKSQQNLPIQEIIKILVRLPESKTNQTSGIALNIILKLFNTPILQEADLHPLLHSLYLFKDEIIDNVQLKLVQCSVHLIHKEIVNINNPECIEKLICIFFTLVISKNPIIQTTSMTGLMKILDFLYAQYSEKPHRNGVLIFLQLIQGMKGQKVPFVVQHQYSKGICRDMIFQIVQNLGPFLNKDEQLSKLIEEISAIIYEEMSLDSADVQFNARRIRDSFRMIVSLQRDISLLKHISLLFTRSPSYGYVRYWILEGILTLLQDPKLVMLLYQGPLQEEQQQQQQQQQSTFLQHLVFIIKLSTEQEPQYTINQSNQQQTFAKQKKLYEQNILNLTEIPIYNKSQFTQKSIECISHFTDSILQIAYEKQIGLFSLNYKLSQSKILIEDNCKEVNQIIETTQQLTLKTVQNLMINLNDEIQYQSILNSIQTWINLSGSLGQNKTRDAFIKFLSSLCVAKQNTTLTKNQLQSAKTLFNIAQLGNLLDIKSWYIIMKAMQQFETLLQKSQNQNTIQQESHPEIYQQEISLLNNILDGLFSSSNVYEDANLLHMIEAINQVTLSLMEQFNNAQSLVDSKSIQFGLQKIHQITKQNWFRINKFWDFITAHFLCIANYKHKAFRESALEIFSYIVQQGFIYFLKPDQSLCWEGDSWQSHLLSPIQQMINIPYADVKETLLNIIFKLIQNNGHELNILGFNTIIEILLISCDETEPTGYVNIGFHILELLIGQFMHLLDPKTTRRLLPLIKQFRQRTTEQNISYVSVGLIWQLADNLSKICTSQTSQTEVEELWTVVLQSLKDLSLDNAPDVRQSALHIIIQIILINCGSFRINFQIDLLKNLIFKILDDLIGRVAQLQQLQVIFHMKVPKYLKEEDYPKFTKFSEQDLQSSVKTQNEVMVAWEDTLKIMIQNLTKFLKKIGQQEDQEFKQHAQQLYNETFIRLIISFKINNLDLRWEIIRLIKENTEIMIEKNLVEQFDWAKEFILCIQEFIGQKIQDNRDVKTLINKILPEVCELYVLFLKAHNKNQNSFPEELVEDLYESYQAIVDLPINIENISNIKIWMDEKQLHDFAEDFYIHLGNLKDKSKFYAFLLLNMKKEGGMTKLQDLVILKYTQLLNKYISDKQLTDPELINQYVDICLIQLSIRQNQQKVNNVKNYNKTNKPLWVQVLPLIIETIQICQKEEYIQMLAEQLNFAQQWDKIVSIDGLKSCIDVELQICDWLLSQDILDREIINYWELLSRNINLYQLEDLFYETRQKLMSIIFKKPKNLMTLNQICQSLVTQFMKDEYMSGSMPLSRKRVQEIIQLLLELQSLKDLNLEPHPLLQVFECLVELITTREIDIKQPLQNLFKSVALKIRSHK
ncbi:unnamed protein product [Paramecium octaurelia]|uniref:Uncharacterized protein n=1 Tax=Paramecium octaurelia TaxID=43137 RepID=A0A8S1S1Q0_PAROT|nr:unnamed protein product [Paramecium octaurelia]